MRKVLFAAAMLGLSVSSAFADEFYFVATMVDAQGRMRNQPPVKVASLAECQTVVGELIEHAKTNMPNGTIAIGGACFVVPTPPTESKGKGA